MEITQEKLTPFQGGQFEWQNPDAGWMFRGQVRSIRLEKNPRPFDIWFNYHLTVEFDWLARMDHGWVETENVPAEFQTMEYRFNMLGQGRLGMVSAVENTLGVFFPPGGSSISLGKEPDVPDSEA